MRNMHFSQKSSDNSEHFGFFHLNFFGTFPIFMHMMFLSCEVAQEVKTNSLLPILAF